MYEKQFLQYFPNFSCFSFIVKIVEIGALRFLANRIKQNQSAVAIIYVEPF